MKTLNTKVMTLRKTVDLTMSEKFNDLDKLMKEALGLGDGPGKSGSIR